MLVELVRFAALRRNLARACACAATLLCALSFTLPASAQTRTWYLDRAQISGAPDDGFMVWRPYMYERTRFYGMMALGWTLNPLRKGTVASNGTVANRIDNPVKDQFIDYLSAGMELTGR